MIEFLNQYPEFKQNAVKKKQQHPVSSSSVCGNVLKEV